MQLLSNAFQSLTIVEGVFENQQRFKVKAKATSDPDATEPINLFIKIWKDGGIERVPITTMVWDERIILPTKAEVLELFRQNSDRFRVELRSGSELSMALLLNGNEIFANEFDVVNSRTGCVDRWQRGSYRASGRTYLDDEEKVGTTHSIRLSMDSADADTGFIGVCCKVPVKSGQRYILSGFIKTADLENARAGFDVELCKDASSLKIWRNNTWLEGTQDWTRQQVVFDAAVDATHAYVYLKIQHKGPGGQGTGWFDWIRLEEAQAVLPPPIQGQTNLQISDGSFVSSAHPENSYRKFFEPTQRYHSLKVGRYDNATGTNHAYLQPDLQPLRGKTIEKATLHICCSHSYLHKEPTGIWLDEVKEFRGVEGLNWNQSSKMKSTNIGCTEVSEGKWASFDVTRSIREALTRSIPLGFKLHVNGHGQSYWKKFFSPYEVGKQPYLSIAYSSQASNVSVHHDDTVNDEGNLLPNPRFEIPDASGQLPEGWSRWAEGDGGHVCLVSTEKMCGTQSVEVSILPKNTQFGWNALTKIIRVEPDTEYVLSGFVKTNLNNADAYFNIQQMQGDDDDSDLNIWTSSHESRQTGGQDWTRQEVRFVTDARTSHIRIHAQVSHVSLDSRGKAWFDHLQLMENGRLIVDDPGSDAVPTIYEARRYDGNGNLVASSKRFGMTPNLVENSSFDVGVGIQGWTPYCLDDRGVITLDPKEKVCGTQSVRITTQSKSDGTKVGCNALVQEISVLPDTVYTFSAFVKTQDLCNAAAFLNTEHLKIDENSNLVPVAKTGPERWQDSRYSQLIGTNGWTRCQVSFKTSPDTCFIRLYLEVSHKNRVTSGIAWFDQIQFEEGAVPTAYNLIEDGCFLRRLDHWKVVPDPHITLYQIKEVEAFEVGASGVKFSRSEPKNHQRRLTQRVVLNQSAASPITVSGLSKAKGVTNHKTTEPNDLYSIVIDIYASDNQHLGRETAKFTLGDHDWERAALTVHPARPIHHIDIHVRFGGGNIGTVWFDNLRVEEGPAITTYQYGEGNFLTKITDVLRNTCQFRKEGDIIVCTDAIGHESRYTYSSQQDDDESKLIAMEPPGGKVRVDYSYERGNLVTKTVTCKDGTISPRTTLYKYDLEDRLIMTTYPSQKSVGYSYGDDGSSSIVNENQVINYQFVGERLVAVEFDGVLRFRYTYEGDTKTVVEDISLKQCTEYQMNDLSQSMLGPGGHLTTWKETEDSILRTVAGLTTRYDFNMIGQNTHIEGPGGENYDLDYDENGHPTIVTLPNGSQTIYTHDAAGRILSIRMTRKEGLPFQTFLYTYDKNNNRKTVNDNVTYRYDEQEQLTQETDPLGNTRSYTYDAVGNRLTKYVEGPAGRQLLTYKYNEMNQLTKLDGRTYTYDEQGNMLSDGVYSYTWDVAGCLTQVTDGRGCLLAEYRYDEQRRRIRSTVNGNITNYIYDRDSIRVLYETNADKQITVAYTYSDLGQPLSMFKGGQHYYYHTNAHGDVVAVTDSNCAVVAAYTYDAWGNILEQSGSLAEENPYRYAGYRYDSVTGFYYLIARYYNPRNGNFISLDPYPGDLEDLHSQNGYSYVSNNPVMKIDPDGCFFWAAVNVAWAAYDGYKAYKRGESVASIAAAAAIGFVGGGRLKCVGKAMNWMKKSIPKVFKRGNVTKKITRTAPPKPKQPPPRVVNSKSKGPSSGSKGGAAKSSQGVKPAPKKHVPSGSKGGAAKSSQGAKQTPKTEIKTNNIKGGSNPPAPPKVAPAKSQATVGNADRVVGNMASGGTVKVSSKGSAPFFAHSKLRLVRPNASSVHSHFLANAFKDTKHLNRVNHVRMRIPVNPIQDNRYTKKVLQQLDCFHNLPKQVDILANQFGKRIIRMGNDRKPRVWIILKGRCNGRKGQFEWIVEPCGTKINHRYFNVE